MKTGLYKTYAYRADYYVLRIAQDTNSGNLDTTLNFDRTIKCRIVTDGSGRLIIYTPEALAVGGRIDNVRDRNEALLMPDGSTKGHQFVIDLMEPELNVFGQMEDWVYACNRFEVA